MSLIANLLTGNSKPICPMLGCGEVIEPGKGQAYLGAEPDLMARLHEEGLLSQSHGMLLVHKDCGQSTGEY